MNEYLTQAKQYGDLSGRMVARGMEAKAKLGIYPGAAPIGYLNVNGRIELDPVRAPLIREAFALQSNRVPVPMILMEVTEKGLRTRRGNKLGLQTLRHILQNPFYKGFILWKGTRYRGTHTPLDETPERTSTG